MLLTDDNTETRGSPRRRQQQDNQRLQHRLHRTASASSPATLQQRSQRVVWRQDKPISFCTGVRATNCVASPLSLLSNSPVAVELSARHFHFRSSPTMHLGLTRSQPQPRSTDRHCFVVAACFCGSSCAVDG